jgi:FAD/FMN-containing dehydrogenase
MTDTASDVAALLRARVRGLVLRPADPGYEPARTPFNAMATGRPVAIVRPVDTDDIVAAIRAATEADLGIGVRGGGHSVAGHSSPEGALLIDLSQWRGATVDPEVRTADALGGSKLMDLDAATSAHELAAPSGTYVDTGIGGLTLSGGISYLLPTEGYACDALIGAELVTATGEVIQVDEAREPELLWALRGGGGNFGVVTQFRYRLAHVPVMYGGHMRFHGDGVLEVVQRAFEENATAPDELALQVVTWQSEDGVVGCSLLVAWRGDPKAGAEVMAPYRAHPTLYQDDVRELNWMQLQTMNVPMAFGYRNYWKGYLVRETPTELAEVVVDVARTAGPGSITLTELIHGEAHRIPASSAAFGGRAAAANVTAMANWTDPAEDARQIAWVRESAARIEPWSLRGAGYLNYPELDQSSARVAAAFEPETFARLRAVKRRVDPDNRFRFNGNIPPR